MYCLHTVWQKSRVHFYSEDTNYESRKRILGHSVKCNVSNVGIGHIKKGMRLKLKMALPWTQDGIALDSRWYMVHHYQRAMTVFEK